MYRLLIIGTILVLSSCNDGSGATTGSKLPSQHLTVEKFPKSISTSCRKGVAKVYDECGDQALIVRNASQQALLENKSVLIVYGAEWCIWCHVFDSYVEGKSRQFNYVWEDQGEIRNWDMEEKENKKAEEEAHLLNEYVSKNFVVAHIEGEFSPNGMDAIAATGFDAAEITYLPFILVLDSNGKYAAHMRAYSAVKGLEIRKDSGEDYRGFDRTILLRLLQDLRTQAIKPSKIL